MGSIQAFPARPRASTLADVWRVGPLPGMGAIRTRPARLEDYAAIRTLTREDSGEPALTLKQFEARRHAFPEGQLVAECGAAIVGMATSLILEWDGRDDVAATWSGLTGEGTFSTHDAHGDTLFGSEITAEVSRRGFGVGRALHQARRRLCRRLNLRRIAAAAPLAGYEAARAAMSPELYAKRVIWGDLDDALLRFNLAQGFHFCGVLPDYLPGAESGSRPAALLVWLNPLYGPPGPRAFMDSERQRKCA
jgi:GNAT superfamily N-acetyltransferase